MVERQSGYYLKTLRSDRGGEYNSKEFQKICEDIGNTGNSPLVIHRSKMVWPKERIAQLLKWQGL